MVWYTKPEMAHIKWHKLSSFSAYSRADPRLCQQTVHGAIGARYGAWLPLCTASGSDARLYIAAVTLAGVALALVLLVAEVKHCLTTQLVQEVSTSIRPCTASLASTTIQTDTRSSRKADLVGSCADTVVAIGMIRVCRWQVHGS